MTSERTEASLLAASLGALGISAEDASRWGSGGDAATASAHSAAEPPALLPELWGAIARAAVKAEGSSLSALQRLSLVCTAWRDALKGAVDALCRWAVRDRGMRVTAMVSHQAHVRSGGRVRVGDGVGSGCKIRFEVIASPGHRCRCLGS